MKRALLMISLLVALPATGCTYYQTLTPPPPGREASLNTSDNEIKISKGVALGFECTTGGGNPCSKGVATVDDESVAKVFPAYLNRLDRFMSGTYAPTSYVVVGVKPGQTWLRIPDEDPLRVTVVE